MTVVSILFVFLILVGAVLVAQPSFLFRHSASIYGKTYTVGVIMSFLVALGGGTCRVLQAFTKAIPSCHFMLIGGITSLSLGMCSSICSIPNHLFQWSAMFQGIWVMLGISGTSLTRFVCLRCRLTYI